MEKCPETLSDAKYSTWCFALQDIILLLFNLLGLPICSWLCSVSLRNSIDMDGACGLLKHSPQNVEFLPQEV